MLIEGGTTNEQLQIGLTVLTQRHLLSFITLKSILPGKEDEVGRDHVEGEFLLEG